MLHRPYLLIAYHPTIAEVSFARHTHSKHNTHKYVYLNIMLANRYFFVVYFQLINILSIFEISNFSTICTPTFISTVRVFVVCIKALQETSRVCSYLFFILYIFFFSFHKHKSRLICGEFRNFSGQYQKHL